MTKPKMLFYRRFTTEQKAAQTMGDHLRMLDMYRGDYDLITYKRDRNNDVYPVVQGVYTPSAGETKTWCGLTEKGTINWPTWRQIVEPHLMDFTALGIKQVVIFGGIILPRTVDFRHKVYPEDELAFLYDEWTKATARENFFSSIYPTLHVLMSANKHNVPVHVIIFDPDEIRLNNSSVMEPGLVTSYHGYDSEIVRAQRLDSLQYSYLQEGSGFSAFFKEEIEKTKDFTFGMSISSVQRAHVFQKVQTALSTLDDGSYNFFIRYPEMKLDTEVPRAEYMHHVERSRFTLVVPAYHPQAFSIYRFIESLNVGCLPLIGEDVVIHEVEKSFGIDLKPLVTEYSRLGEKIAGFDEETRINMVEHYKSKVLVFEKKLAI